MKSLTQILEVMPLTEAKEEWHLLGTSPSLNQMRGLLAQFWYNPDELVYTFKQISKRPDIYTIMKLGKEIVGSRILKKAGRYRFEIPKKK